MFLSMFALNKKAFKLTIKSFDFWIKTIYAILWIAAWNVVVLSNPKHESNSVIGIIENAVYGLFVILWIVYLGMLDANSNATVRWKVIFSVLSAIWYTWESLSVQFFYIPSYDVFISLGYKKISVIGLLPGFVRVIAIFMWKQAFNALFKQEQCIVIKYTPKITWIDEDKVK